MTNERGARFSVPRRTSVRRLPSTRWTTDIPQRPQPAPRSPDYSRCIAQSAPAQTHPAPNDRTIPAARKAARSGQVSNSPHAPNSPSATEARGWRLAGAESIREHDCPLWSKRAVQRVLFGPRSAALLAPHSQLPAASRTSAPTVLCPNNGLSKQTLFLQTASQEADTARSANFRKDARSQIATQLPGRYGAGAYWRSSWKQCAVPGEIVSNPARRTELRRGTLKACATSHRHKPLTTKQKEIGRE